MGVKVEILKVKKLQDVDLVPLTLENIDIDLAIKYDLLFSEVDGEDSVVINSQSLSDALAYLSKENLNLPIVELDIESFSRLKNKFLEIQRSSDFEKIDTQTATNKEFIEVETDLLEFLKNSQDLLSNEESAPIIKLVNSLFFQAIQKNASDIHIENAQHKGEVRFRVDGALTKHIDLDKNITSLVISRIKVISNLDISEKRVSQDGRTQVTIAGKSLDIRVSMLPTYYGERVVMRILMQGDAIPSLGELGFNETLTKSFYKLLNHTHGMILVTGPTGSGKSTTLHAFLQHISTPDKNIITVEDPVEYNAGNINQVQVNTKAGLTFSSALRSILRQDPDVIMIGEIRDGETAKISIQSALTGHLVLSTLHTNDSTSAITRLFDMGVEDFLISSTVLGVLAQRLVRKICDECKQKTIAPQEVAKEFNITGIIYKAVGCKSCNFTGYSGRVAVGELFVIDDKVQDMIKNGLTENQIREKIKKNGMITLSDAILELLSSGQTSLAESIRVGLMDG